jgi:glycogen phosphorylase
VTANEKQKRHMFLRGCMNSETGNKSETASTKRNGHENIRTGHGADAIAEALIDNLHYLQAKLPQHATRNDWYIALAYTVRDRMLDRYIKTLEAIISAKTPVKAVAYLSAEFLTGPPSRQQPDQPWYLAGYAGSGI